MGLTPEPLSLALHGAGEKWPLTLGEREKQQSRSTSEPSAPELAFTVVIGL